MILESGNASDCWRPPEARREAWNWLSFRASRRNQSCQHFDFAFPASSAVREWISATLSYQVCGDILQQLQEIRKRSTESPEKAKYLFFKGWISVWIWQFLLHSTKRYTGQTRADHSVPRCHVLLQSSLSEGLQLLRSGPVSPEAGYCFSLGFNFPVTKWRCFRASDVLHGKVWGKEVEGHALGGGVYVRECNWHNLKLG